MPGALCRKFLVFIDVAHVGAKNMTHYLQWPDMVERDMENNHR